jgi:hypothetical protein
LRISKSYINHDTPSFCCWAGFSYVARANTHAQFRLIALRAHLIAEGLLCLMATQFVYGSEMTK